jgi:hypothetical protein
MPVARAPEPTGLSDDDISTDCAKTEAQIKKKKYDTAMMVKSLQKCLVTILLFPSQ